jgi:curved DNA-binding protein CbpA
MKINKIDAASLDLYGLLEVQPDATEKEIRKA